jgi:hypothetical protein
VAAPMSDRQRQQRAAMIVGGAAVGGLAIIGLAIALSSGGGDDTNAVDTRRTTTSSSSTTSSSTSTSTTTLVTLPPTVPATIPPTAPPTTAFVFPTAPPTAPPTSPPTSPPTTKPPTTTTKAPSPAEQLALSLDTALNDGQPNAPARVTVLPMGSHKVLDVTWALDASLTPEQQGDQARADALVLLQSVQAANPPGNNKFKLRATIPKPGKDQVILLTINRAEFDAFDFSSFNPDDEDVFKLPFVTSSDINESYVPDPYPPPTTTTSEETTTTTT